MLGIEILLFMLSPSGLTGRRSRIERTYATSRVGASMNSRQRLLDVIGVEPTTRRLGTAVVCVGLT
jgi:hypothetical protein